MRVTYMGHSSFVFEEDDYRLCVDPYDEIRGYEPLHVVANEVLCTHEHHDHNNRNAVQLISATEPTPFEIQRIDSYHDEKQGALRGKNTIFVISCGNTRVAHFGDLGTLLYEQQLESLGHIDMALLPVGGVYTINGQEATEVWKQCGCPAVIPMHYRTETLDYEQLSTYDEFVKAISLTPTILESNYIEVTKGIENKLFIPQYKGGTLE